LIDRYENSTRRVKVYNAGIEWYGYGEWQIKVENIIVLRRVRNIALI
jgi:hypothetical protein